MIVPFYRIEQFEYCPMEQGGPLDQDHGQEVKLIKKAVIPLLVDIYKDCKDDETKKSSTCQTVLRKGNQQREWTDRRSQEGGESWQPKC